MKQVLYILAVFLLIDCTQGKTRNQFILSNARELLPLYPDSALTVLQGVSGGELITEERAVAALLKYRIAEASEFEYYNDSLLARIIDNHQYLTETGDVAWSLYYKGLYRGRKSPGLESMNYLNLAGQYAARTKDNYLRGRIHNTYSDIFRSALLFQVSLKHCEKAYEYLIASGDSLAANRTLRNKVMLNFITGNDSEGYDQFLKTILFAKAKNDTRYIISLLGELILYNIRTNDLTTARILFKDMNAFRDSNEYTIADCIALGAFYLDDNALDSARHYLSMAEQLAKAKRENFLTNRLMMKLNRETENYREAFHYADKLSFLYDSLYRGTIRTSLSRAQDRAKELETHLTVIKIKNQRKTMIYAVSFGFIALVAMFFFFRTRLKQGEMELQNRLAVIDDLNTSRETLLEKLNDQKENELKLKKEIEKVLDSAKGLADLYYSKQGKFDAAFRKMNNLVVFDPRNENFQDNFIDLVNKYYNNAIEKLAKSHLGLNENEILFCGLLISGFTPQQMSVILNCSSIDGIYSRKYRLKYKLFGSKNVNIEDYLLKFAG